MVVYLCKEYIDDEPLDYWKNNALHPVRMRALFFK